jgi:outer membrane biosynthesis protein TonB
MEVVIDTSGHAERGTIRVLSSTHQLFEGPAREVVQGSLFSPGRIQGRAVRVRVQVPINFTIARAGQANP